MSPVVAAERVKESYRCIICRPSSLRFHIAAASMDVSTAAALKLPSPTSPQRLTEPHPQSLASQNPTPLPKFQLPSPQPSGRLPVPSYHHRTRIFTSDAPKHSQNAPAPPPHHRLHPVCALQAASGHQAAAQPSDGRGQRLIKTPAEDKRKLGKRVGLRDSSVIGGV